ncbi:MAG: hypothetical protein GF308_12740 [Candidatus Heimdallarchaeota archaeon]|nr:hypothetical protein [Candidatus Heimdallarchaeota archaeon]
MSRRRKTELPFAPIARIIREVTDLRAGNDASTFLKEKLEEKAEELAKSAAELAEYADRITIRDEDVKFALSLDKTLQTKISETEVAAIETTIPQATVERIMKEVTDIRVADNGSNQLRIVLEDIAKVIAHDGRKFAEHAGRKTVKEEDIKRAWEEIAKKII